MRTTLKNLSIGGLGISLLLLLVMSLISWGLDKEGKLVLPYEEGCFQEIICEAEFEEEEEKKAPVSTKIGVTLTVYNPVVSQCDSDPWITADNSRISEKKLRNGTLKWVAVSRDLLKMKFKYGDKVNILCPDDPSLSGVYEIHDTMNKRYKRSVDILFHQEVRAKGKYNGTIEVLEN